jgi:hypothetical protein
MKYLYWMYHFSQFLYFILKVAEVIDGLNNLFVQLHLVSLCPSLFWNTLQRGDSMLVDLKILNCDQNRLLA